jgi:transcriptional regulator with XRE-family HTH domain
MQKESRIKSIINFLGLSQSEVAEKLGYVRAQSVSDNLKPGKASNKFVFLFCEKFNVNPDWIELGSGAVFADSTQKLLDLTLALKFFSDIENVETLEFVANLCDEFGINRNWLVFGTGPAFADNERGKETATKYAVYLHNKLLDNRERLEALKAEEAKEFQEELTKAGIEYDSPEFTNWYNKVYRKKEITDYELKRAESIDSISFENENIESTLEKINKLFPDVTKLEQPHVGENFLHVEPNSKKSKLVNMGREEYAIIAPYLHDFYTLSYPAKASDQDFVDSLPRHIFRSFGQPPKEKNLAVQNSDRNYSMDQDEGNADSIKGRALLPGDIAIGVYWDKLKTTFDTDGINKQHLDFIIVTKSEVLCRNLKQIDRKAGTMTFTARNPDKTKYPDLTIAIDDIQEMYMIRRIERPKLEGVPAI